MIATSEKELFVGLRWDVCKYKDELENTFHDERVGYPFYHYTGQDDTWNYSPITVALRVQTTDDIKKQLELDAELTEDEKEEETIPDVERLQTEIPHRECGGGPVVGEDGLLYEEINYDDEPANNEDRGQKDEL